MDKNEVFENNYFVLIKRLRINVCIWPYQNKTLKFYGRIFIVFALFSMMIPQMIKFYEEFYEVDRDVQILVENFAGFLVFNAAFYKLYSSVDHEKKFQLLYETITKDYDEIEEPGERAAMDDLRNFARMLSIIYTTYATGALFLFVFTPQVVPVIMDAISPLNESRPKMICYYAEYFIDQDEYLEILVFHTFVVVAITLNVYVAVETTFVTVAYHVLGLYNVLTYRLEQLCDWAKVDVNRKDERLHNFVIDTIKIHKKALEFAELVRITYDTSNFVIFSLALVGLSVGAIDIMMSLTRPEVITRISLVFIGVILQLFFTNWPGQRYLDSSFHLKESIYSCNWHALPLKTQFLLRLMMLRCTKPSQLTAGPLFQMNFAFCGSILKTALSYFMAAYSFT